MTAELILSIITALSTALPKLIDLLKTTPNVTQEQINQALVIAAQIHKTLQETP